jgi:DNA polymerase-1
MKALVDTEVYLFRAAAACEFEIEWAPDDWTYICRHGDAQALFQDSIAEIMENLPGLRPVLVFSAGVSFRYGVWPAYKANRKKHRKPAGYRKLKEWVANAAVSRGWEVVELPDIEGDDVLGVLYEEGDVICSIDKDMLTLPGFHFRNGEVIEVSRAEADLNFYTQALTGDASDNYPGCPGYGPETALKLLGGGRILEPYNHTFTRGARKGESETRWEPGPEGSPWEIVISAFASKGLSKRHAITQARCARILRPGEYDLSTHTVRLWEPPVT